MASIGSTGVKPRTYLVIACLAAIVATTGDFMLLFSGDPLAPEVLLTVGNFLGVIFIPVYAAGYHGLALLLEDRWPSTAKQIRAMGFVAAFLGAAIHGMTSIIIAAMRDRIDATDHAILFEPFALYIGPLWAISTVAIFIVSVLFIKTVLSSEGGLPKSLILFSPLVLIVIVFLVGLPTAWGQAYLIPAGPNFIHILFFAILARNVKRFELR